MRALQAIILYAVILAVVAAVIWAPVVYHREVNPLSRPAGGGSGMPTAEGSGARESYGGPPGTGAAPRPPLVSAWPRAGALRMHTACAAGAEPAAGAADAADAAFVFAEPAGDPAEHTAAQARTASAMLRSMERS